MKRILSAALALAASSSLTSACIDTYEEEFTINHHLVGCGVQRTTCIQVKDGNAGEYRTLRGGIAGFDFEWGVTSRVLVKTSEYSEPFGSDRSFAYELIEVIDQTQVPANFQFEVQLKGSDVSGTTAEPLVFGEAADCVAPSVCGNLVNLAGSEGLPVTLRYGATPDEPLTIVEVGQ